MQSTVIYFFAEYFSRVIGSRGYRVRWWMFTYVNTYTRLRNTHLSFKSRRIYHELWSAIKVLGRRRVKNKPSCWRDVRGCNDVTRVRMGSSRFYYLIQRTLWLLDLLIRSTNPKDTSYNRGIIFEILPGCEARIVMIINKTIIDSHVTTSDIYWQFVGLYFRENKPVLLASVPVRRSVQFGAGLLQFGVTISRLSNGQS